MPARLFCACRSAGRRGCVPYRCGGIRTPPCPCGTSPLAERRGHKEMCGANLFVRFRACSWLNAFDLFPIPLEVIVHFFPRPYNRLITHCRNPPSFRLQYWVLPWRWEWRHSLQFPWRLHFRFGQGQFGFAIIPHPPHHRLPLLLRRQIAPLLPCSLLLLP